jgi:hypothetical protein
MLEEVRPGDARRVYYDRTGSPLWKIIEASPTVGIRCRCRTGHSQSIPQLKQEAPSAPVGHTELTTS